MSEIRTIHKTTDADVERTGMALTLGHESDSGTYGLSVFNVDEGMSAWAVFTREQMLSLRDALTKELAN